MRVQFIIILVFILTSCETDWGGYNGYKVEYESAMEYYIVLDKGEIVYASDSKIEELNKSTIITYFRASGEIDTVLLGRGGIVIESFVDTDMISHDSTFILIAQKPLSSICECNDSCLITTYPNRNDLPTYKKCKEALKTSLFYQYWIIDKTKDAVYGPYNKEKYFEKRKTIGVSDELVFKAP